MAQGLAALFPPGMAGYLASQQMGDERERGQVARATGLMALMQAAQAQEDARQVKPLQLQQLQMAVEQAKANNNLRQLLMQGLSGGNQQGPTPVEQGGDGRPVVGGMSVPGQAAPSSQRGSFFGINPMAAALRLSGDPGLGGVGTMIHESTKPMPVAEGGGVFIPGVGEVYSRPKLGENVLPVRDASGQVVGVRPMPGATEALAGVRRAEEGAKAAFDMIEVSDGTGRKRMMTRAQASALFGEQPPAPQPAPVPFPRVTPQEQASRDADATALKNNERVTSAGGASAFPPTSRVVAGSTAGLGITPSPAEAAAATATAKERAEGGVKFEETILDQGRAARTNMTNLQILAPNLERLPTGPLFPLLAGGAAYFKQFGIDVPGLGQQLGTAQATDAILKQLALKVRDPSTGGGMPGALSDADRNYLVNSIPGLNKVPDGNRQLIAIMTALEQRKIDEAGIVSNMRKAGVGSEEIRAALRQFADTRPLFARK